MLKLGSAGTGNGFNTYKLAWSVEKDSSSVDYADMDLKISFGQKADDLNLFKTTKVGKSGSLDFSYINAVDIAGWSWIDKLKEKLPILDPSPTYMIVSFLVNGVWNDISFSIKLDYDGRVTLDGNSEQTDHQYNVYKMIAGNNAGENNKNDMDDDDKDKDDDEKGDGDDKKYTGGTDSVNGSALLTTSYSLTVTEAHSFGSWLWSSTMIDNIHLVNNNPIENIVACKLFPFSVGGTESSIQLGNVTSNVTGQKLAENVDVVAFEGEADVSNMFTYGVDFFMGDIVQIADEYGHETKSRMVELVSSESEEGITSYPTFAYVDNN